MKKIVLKTCILCLKCKTCVMRTVAKIEGINDIMVDEEKGTLTVIGDADPVIIVKKLRKTGKGVTIVSVKENTAPDPKPKPEPEPKPDPCKASLPPYCRSCQPVSIGYIAYDEPNGCTVL